MTAKSLFAASLGCILTAISAQAFPEKAWPEAKEIRLVVPFPAGGGADTLARIIAPELSSRLGQTVIVENIAGAGGSLGTEQASRAKNDGYTLLYVTNGTLGTNPALYPHVGYDPLKDFAPVARLTEIAMVMSVNPKRHSETSLKDFLNKAKASSLPFTFSSAGNGTTSHLAGVMLASGEARLPLPRRRTSTKTSSSPSQQTRSSSYEPLRQLRASIRIPAFFSQSAAASSPARPFSCRKVTKASPAAPSAVRAKRPGTSSGAWGTAQARAGRQNALWSRSPCAWQNHSRDSGGRAYP